MITAEHSKTGQPLMVGGPQIGYFYPGLTYEIDMHAGDLQWRGATSAPFPGYVLIGRGEDFAHTLTSASGDIIDQYAEKLCNGSDTMYVYKGECLRDGHLRRRHPRRRAGHLPDHRPRAGRRLRDRRRRAGRDLVASAPATARTRSTCSTTAGSPTARCTARSRSSRRPSLTPQTFNSFYIDDENIAMYTAGLLPIRNEKVDPGLPTLGTGKYEWTGLPRQERPPAGDRPRGRHDHQLEPDHAPRASPPPTTSAATTARSGASTCSTRTSTGSATKKGKWTPGLGDRGDERRRDPGRARDRHRAAAEAAAQGHHGPDAAGAADARPDGRLEAARRQPPRPRPRRQDRRPGRRGHGRLLEPDRRRVHGAEARATSSTSSTRCSRASTCRPAASTTAGTSTSTATSARCSARRSSRRSRTPTAATAS